MTDRMVTRANVAKDMAEFINCNNTAQLEPVLVEAWKLLTTLIAQNEQLEHALTLLINDVEDVLCAQPMNAKLSFSLSVAQRTLQRNKEQS